MTRFGPPPDSAHSTPATAPGPHLHIKQDFFSREFILLFKLFMNVPYHIMKQYTEEYVQAALKAISASTGAREASLYWGIPRSTLYSPRRGSSYHSDAANWQIRLSSTQESSLIKFSLTQAALGLPLTHLEIRTFAARVANPQPRPPPLRKR